MSGLVSSPSVACIESGLGRLIVCSVDILRLHPTLDRLKIVPSARDISAATGQYASKEALTITQDFYILAGHARWNVARSAGEKTLPCLQLDMTEEDALLWLIQKHQRSSTLNDFNRIRLVLELEDCFKARARSNQQVGGQMKASSNLAEADKLDVRSMLADAAGVSTGNVTKVKVLVSGAHPEVLEALRAGEVSIHRAWGWLREPGKQIVNLNVHRNRHGITRTVKRLLDAHRCTRSESTGRLDLQRVAAAMQSMTPEQREEILVVEIKTPGNALMLSTAFAQALTSQGRLER